MRTEEPSAEQCSGSMPVSGTSTAQCGIKRSRGCDGGLSEQAYLSHLQMGFGETVRRRVV